MADENQTAESTAPAVEAPVAEQNTPETSGYPTAKAAMDAVYSGTYKAPEPAPVLETTPPAAADAPPTPEPVITPEPITPAVEAAPDWGKLTNGLVANYEELQAAVQERQKLKENPIAALQPAEQKVVELLRKGEDVMEFIQFQNTDFAKMDAMEILRFQFNQEPKTKNAPAEIREALWEERIKKNYPNLEGFDENDLAYKVARWDMQSDAENARQQLLAKKQEMAIPAYEPQATGGSAEPQQPQISEAEVAAHLQQVRQAASFKSISVDVQDGDAKQALQLPVTGTPEFFTAVERPGDALAQRWTNADGSFNYQQQALDMAAIFHAQQWNQAAYNEGLKAGQAKVKTVLENPEPLPSTAIPSTEPDRAGLIAAIKQQTRSRHGQYADF